MTKTRRTLVLGGARSGKSRYAEDLACASGLPVTYIATAGRRDDDQAFAERIEMHRVRRPAAWGLIEADADLAGALRGAVDAAASGGCVLIDCLTLWLTRLLCPADGGAPLADWRERLDAFDEALRAVADGHVKVIVVSNEIGLGVVPMGSLTRLFVDELGRLNQRVAAICEEVVLTVAGLPLLVKTDAGK